MPGFVNMAITECRVYKFTDTKLNESYYYPVYITDRTTQGSYNFASDILAYIKSSNVYWSYPIKFVSSQSEGAFTNVIDDLDGDLSITKTKASTGNYTLLYTIDNVVGYFSITKLSSYDNIQTLIPPIVYNPNADIVWTSSNLTYCYFIKSPSDYINVIAATSYPSDKPGSAILKSIEIDSVNYHGYQYGYVSLTSTDNNRVPFVRRLMGLSKLLDPDDPNRGSGDSQGNGGNPPDDIGGDPHKTGEIPTISALDSGLLTLYNPTTEQLQSLGQFLWSDSFDINSFKKLFNDPFDTLLGLSIVPVKPTVSGTHNIMFGNLDSGVSSNVVAKQWVSVDCGTLTLNETWHGALDYAPSTQVSIYLPFIGVRQLNVNDVMGSVLHLYYNFDVLTGSCIAEITINHSGQGNKSSGWGYNADMGSVYTFEGQCAVNIPLASQDFTNTIRAAIGAVGMVAGAAASCATGNPALGVASLMMGTAQAGMTASTPTVERSGHLSSSSALMASLEPCLFIQRPHICKPERYYTLRGVPSQVYVSAISSCTGFFQLADIHNIHVSGATDSELDMIKDALTSGVFVKKWATETVDKQDTLKITLYNNKSAKNKIDKEISAVRDDNILDGTFRDSCDIENPVIRLKINDVSSLNNLNYMYIGIFQRYYYITKIVSMRNHIIEITGHVDVLMTYAKEIGQNTGIIARSSQVPAYGNTYLDDNELATYSDTYNVSYPWGYSFSHSNDSLLLAVAGASVSSST